jgi:hypothetical protein
VIERLLDLSSILVTDFKKIVERTCPLVKVRFDILHKRKKIEITNMPIWECVRLDESSLSSNSIS